MIAADPALTAECVQAMQAAEPAVRMLAADALEKASRAEPALLNPYSATLLAPVAEAEQQEVRWHLLQMLPRLALTEAEHRRAAALAERSLDHPSRIVGVEALMALHSSARITPEFDPRISDRLQTALHDPAPSVRSRARKLLKSDAKLASGLP